MGRKLWKVRNGSDHYGNGHPEDSGVFYVAAESVSKAIRIATEAYERRWAEKQDGKVLEKDGSLVKSLEFVPFLPKVVELVTENMEEV